MCLDLSENNQDSLNGTLTQCMRQLDSMVKFYEKHGDPSKARELQQKLDDLRLVFTNISVISP